MLIHMARQSFAHAETAIGFNYSFNALAPEGEPNELNDALRNMLAVPSGFPILQILQSIFPILDNIVDVFHFVFAVRYSINISL